VAAGLVILSRLLGLAVGLSGLTAWAIYRFDAARRSLEVFPPGPDRAALMALPDFVLARDR